LGEPLRGGGETHGEVFDAGGEDFRAVDPDDAVPGEGEEGLLLF